MRILIKKGRILNPDKNEDFVGDILVENDIIVKKASDINEDADEIIDADGCFVMPGLIDLHVHSNKSDGTLTPSELVAYAVKKGLTAFALTDHDTTDGLKEALETATAFATSSGEPQPNATIKSAPATLKPSVALLTVSVLGFASVSVKLSLSIPAVRSAS